MRIVSDVAHATAFLTCLPVPARAFGGSRLDFARQSWAFPLVAAPLAAMAGAACWAALALFGSASAAGIFVVGTLALLTGALHEDGLADCADGFWGGHEPARRMAIMRDSAIGTYGVVALIVLFALRVEAVRALLLRFDLFAFAALLLATVAFGRTALILPWALTSPAPRGDDGAKGESLASRFGRPDGKQALLASAACFVLLVPASFASGLLTLIGAVALGGAAALLAARTAHAKIGGHTGDTLGATVLLAETGFLFGALAST